MATRERSTAEPPRDGATEFHPLLPVGSAHPARSFLSWSLASTAFHGLAFGALIWVSLASATAAPPQERMAFIEFAPRLSVPEPPPAPTPPRFQAAAAAPGRGFQTLSAPLIVLPEIPPPAVGGLTFHELDFSGEGVEGGFAIGDEAGPTVEPVASADAGPSFTPYTVAPWLKNAREVANTLEREYPTSLRRARIGAEILVWLFIDENGIVRRTVLKESSGFESLDQAALRVASTMEFSPALNRDRKIPVWVEVPVVFRIG
jgi:protein TonB